MTEPTPKREFTSEPHAASAPQITPSVGATLEATAIHPPQPSPQDQATLPPTDSSLELMGGPRPNVPGYEILNMVERGGMGVVYKAVQSGINRMVALKMIRSGECAEPQELLRFQVEAQAVAQLDHPQIVRIYDFGEWRLNDTAPPLPYFSMEFVDGGSLDKKLAAGALPSRCAAELAELLARAVHFVHQRGIVHRDLKPANVLLTVDGVPKIADFGLAKKLDGDLGLTMTKTVMGTASYMAPEQAAGKTREIGAAADIYALGAILYEMLSGKPPFRADTRELTIYQVVTEDPVPPTRHRTDVPGELEAICLKCLEKEPAQRYANAETLADDLRRWLLGEPISTSMASEEDRHTRWAKRAGYEIVELLGCGRTGYVYKARQLSLNRLVTLKLLPVHSDPDQSGRARFRAEAEAVARLHHPNIAQIYDLGEQQGQPYLVFEYVDGVSLSEKVGDAPLTPRAAAALAESLARTLYYAHLRGIVHCGLTPGCVLITPDGGPKVTRFGVARMLGQLADRAEEELATGRLPSYSAPEQLDGQAQETAPTEDVYGLGAILYYLLTGRAPFVADSMQDIRKQIQHTEPLRPSAIQTDVPVELDSICLKCLQKDPGRRYQTMEALAKDLQRVFTSDQSRTDLNLMARLSRTAIPGYVISGELGQTRHFTIYKALQVGNQRIVALKVIPADLPQVAPLRETLDRVKRIYHPNIAPIYDVGAFGGIVYLAEELVTSGNLRKRLSTRMEPREAARLCLTVTRAIEYAHQHDIVHGGLKLANVLMDGDGVPKLSDFGLPSSATPYMAPERAQGEAFGPSADVYSLGAILYHLITGQPPFRGDTEDEVKQLIIGSTTLMPSRLQPDIPASLEAICLRCLQKDPAARFARASDLADELHRFVEGGRWASVRRWFNRLVGGK